MPSCDRKAIEQLICNILLWFEQNMSRNWKVGSLHLCRGCDVKWNVAKKRKLLYYKSNAYLRRSELFLKNNSIETSCFDEWEQFFFISCLMSYESVFSSKKFQKANGSICTVLSWILLGTKFEHFLATEDFSMWNTIHFFGHC